MNIYDNLELLPADLTGFNQYKSPIFYNLIQEICPKIIIEVGTWKGGSAFTMCEAIKKLNLNSRLYCVDTWLGALEFFDSTRGWLYDDFYKKERDLMYKNGYPNIYYQFLSNVVHTDNKDIIIPIPNTSLIASRYFKNNNIKAELIYIDGSHHYDDVKIDIENYYNLLDDKGIIFGDDYNSLWGVVPAVNEFVEKHNLALDVFDSNFWIIRK